MPPPNLPPLPAGASWGRCELFGTAGATDCESQLQYSADQFRWVVPADVDVWDTYFSILRPILSEDSWQAGNVSVTGLRADELATVEARGTFSRSMILAAQDVCCLVEAGVVDVIQDDAGNATSVMVRVQATSNKVSSAVLATRTAAVLPALGTAAGSARLVQELQAAGFAGVTAVRVLSAPSVLLPAQSYDSTNTTAEWPAEAVRTITGVAIGVGGALLIACAALTCLLCCGGWRLLGGLAPCLSPSRELDVFLSYRRQDLKVADGVYDKLCLAGLRVFYDRNGSMAGRPFEQEIGKAICHSAAFAAVISLDSVRVWASHTPEVADYTLAEFLVAYQVQRRSGRGGNNPFRIFPLLIGELRDTDVAGGSRDYLPNNAAFQALRAALPDVPMQATCALASSMLHYGGGAAHKHGLDADLRRLTLRQALLGRAAGTAGDAKLHPASSAPASEPEFTGLLQITPVVLHGPEEQANLVLRYRYAEAMVAALRGAA